jgi:uncharacterized protein
MDASIAERAIDFIAGRTLPGEKIDIGFFGGEPLLALPLILDIVRMVRSHPVAENREIEFQLVSNGTLVDSSVLHALGDAGIDLGISCDGAPGSHDAHRRYKDGRSSSRDVENAIVLAVREIPSVMVNAVYRPDTIRSLPDTIAYFLSLGVRNIFLNADFSASWKEGDIEVMRESYKAVADQYQTCHLLDDPVRVSLIDAKIAVIINGGYAASERCSMGRREFAFGPEGNIYPCERLAGDCLSDEHRIGSLLDEATVVTPCRGEDCTGMTLSCSDCSVSNYCMHWCGCSNYFATGSYDRPGAFLCASEKEAVRQATRTMERLFAEIGPDFLNGLKSSGQHSNNRQP